VPKTMKDLMKVIRNEARAAGARGLAELRAFEAFASGVSSELKPALDDQPGAAKRPRARHWATHAKR